MFDDILEEKKEKKIKACCMCGKIIEEDNYIFIDENFYTCSEKCAMVFDDLFSNLKM